MSWLPLVWSERKEAIYLILLLVLSLVALHLELCLAQPIASHVAVSPSAVCPFSFLVNVTWKVFSFVMARTASLLEVKFVLSALLLLPVVVT